jgi:hypothetical protein
MTTSLLAMRILKTASTRRNSNDDTSRNSINKNTNKHKN